MRNRIDHFVIRRGNLQRHSVINTPGDHVVAARAGTERLEEFKPPSGEGKIGIQAKSLLWQESDEVKKRAADDAVISRIYREPVKRPSADVWRYYSIPRGGWGCFHLQTLPQAGHSRTTLKASNSCVLRS